MRTCFRAYRHISTVVLSQCQNSCIRPDQRPTPLSSRATASSVLQGLYQVKLRMHDPIGRMTVAMLNRQVHEQRTGGANGLHAFFPSTLSCIPMVHTHPLRFNAFHPLYYVHDIHVLPYKNACNPMWSVCTCMQVIVQHAAHLLA